MTTDITIQNDRVEAFKKALIIAELSAELRYETVYETTFRIEVSFINQLFYLGSSYGMNSLTSGIIDDKIETI